MTDQKTRRWGCRILTVTLVPLTAWGLTGCSGPNPAPEERPVEQQFGEPLADEPFDRPASERAPDDQPPEDFTYDLTYPYAPDYREGIPDDLADLTGETVAFKAEIEEVVSETAFIVTDPGDSGNEELLVFHDQSLPEATAGMGVGIQGVVQDSFDLSAIEEDRQTDLNDELYEDSAGEIYIDSTNVDTSTAGPELGADVEDIVQAEDVTEETGKTLTIEGEVEEVFSPVAFTIHGTEDPAAGDLLIIGGEGPAELAEDTPVRVTGVLKKDFILSEVEQELGLDLEEELFVNRIGERYLLATSVDSTPDAGG